MLFSILGQLVLRRERGETSLGPVLPPLDRSVSSTEKSVHLGAQLDGAAAAATADPEAAAATAASKTVAEREPGKQRYEKGGLGATSASILSPQSLSKLRSSILR